KSPLRAASVRAWKSSSVPPFVHSPWYCPPQAGSNWRPPQFQFIEPGNAGDEYQISFVERGFELQYLCGAFRIDIHRRSECTPFARSQEALRLSQHGAGPLLGETANRPLDTAQRLEAFTADQA